MDNASDSNLERLLAIGQEVADDSDARLDAFVELLVTKRAVGSHVGAARTCSSRGGSSIAAMRHRSS